MRARTTAGVCVVAIAMLIVVPAAAALAPGVHVNPGSPSGTEYSFPLGSTRQQLGGHSAARASAGSGPLFGVGLGRGPTSGRGARGGGAGRGGAGRGGAGRGSAGRGDGGRGLGATGRGRGRRRRRVGAGTRRGAADAGIGRDGGESLRREQGAALAELDQGGSSSAALELTVVVILVGGAAGVALWRLTRRRRTDRQ